MSGVVVEVAAKKVWFPFECACCAGYPDTELRVRPRATVLQRLTRRTNRGITVPYCKRCVAHGVRSRRAARAAAATMVAASGASVAIACTVSIALAIGVLATGVLAAMGVGHWQRRAAIAGCRPSCVRAVHAVECLQRSRHRGVFAFASRRYAAKFAIQNLQSLVNMEGELLALIDEFRHRGDTGPKPVLTKRQAQELMWLTARPRRRSRRWWREISAAEPTQLSLRN